MAPPDAASPAGKNGRRLPGAADFRRRPISWRAALKHRPPRAAAAAAARPSRPASAACPRREPAAWREVSSTGAARPRLRGEAAFRSLPRGPFADWNRRRGSRNGRRPSRVGAGGERGLPGRPPGPAGLRGHAGLAHAGSQPASGASPARRPSPQPRWSLRSWLQAAPRCSAGWAPTTAGGRTPRCFRRLARAWKSSTKPSCSHWKSTTSSTSSTRRLWRMPTSTTSRWCSSWGSTPLGRPPSSGKSRLPASLPGVPASSVPVGRGGAEEVSATCAMPGSLFCSPCSVPLVPINSFQLKSHQHSNSESVPLQGQGGARCPTKHRRGKT